MFLQDEFTGANMRVAFLGLGIMGRSMAANLAKAGHEVTTWNRSPGKEVEGARSAASPAEAAQGAEVVWMCVSDTKAVESVLFGAQGVHESLTEGTIIADSSTISPSASSPSGCGRRECNTWTLR
jgi:3-hydroxyisobutyrate dehydrogenase-like beta-hydroxyacid dehydrogenase